MRFGAKLLQKLGYLTGALAGADFAPTDQELEVKALLHSRLREHLGALDELMEGPVSQLNAMLAARGLLIIT